MRETVHGPIVSDVLDLDAASAAPVPDDAPGSTLRGRPGWTALQPGRTADAVLAMNVARTPTDIRAAAALLDVPSQNIVFATTDGHIGYQAPGRIPVRADVAGGPVPSDGTWPRPGWDSRYDWQGYVDPDEMPRALDPAEGFIVTANQAVTPAGVGPFLTDDWDYGYRAQRIRDLLAAATADGKLNVADMSAIQIDQHNPYADVLVPALLSLRHRRPVRRRRPGPAAHLGPRAVGGLGRGGVLRGGVGGPARARVRRRPARRPRPDGRLALARGRPRPARRARRRRGGTTRRRPASSRAATRC